MDSKEAIIHHGIRMFVERGYEGFSMRDLCDAVGIKQPSIYYYFKDKRALFAACAKGFYDIWNMWLEENLSQSANLKDFLRDTCRSFGDTRGLVEKLYGVKTAAGQYQMVLDILKYAPEAMESMYRFDQIFRGLISQHVEEAKRQGVVRADLEAASLHITLTALIEGSGLITTLMPEAPIDGEADNMFQLLWRGIAAGSGSADPAV